MATERSPFNSNIRMPCKGPKAQSRSRMFSGTDSRCTHGRHTQTTKASFGEAAMQGLTEAQSPRTLRAKDCLKGRLLGDSEATEFLKALAPRLPLNPGDAT